MVPIAAGAAAGALLLMALIIWTVKHKGKGGTDK